LFHAVMCRATLCFPTGEFPRPVPLHTMKLRASSGQLSLKTASLDSTLTFPHSRSTANSCTVAWRLKPPLAQVTAKTRARSKPPSGLMTTGNKPARDNPPSKLASQFSLALHFAPFAPLSGTGRIAAAGDGSMPPRRTTGESSHNRTRRILCMCVCSQQVE
jgi:hypothetical protein